MGKSIYQPPFLQPGESGTIKWLNNIIRLLTDLLNYGSTSYIRCDGDFQPQGKMGRQNGQFNRKSTHSLFRMVQLTVAMSVGLEKLPADYAGEGRVTTVLPGLQVTTELNRANVKNDLVVQVVERAGNYQSCNVASPEKLDSWLVRR